MGPQYDRRSCPRLCQAQFRLLLSTNIRRGQSVKILRHSDNPCQHSNNHLDDGILLRIPIHVQDQFQCVLDVGTGCDYPLWKDYWHFYLVCCVRFCDGSCDIHASSPYGTRLQWLAWTQH